MRRVFCGVALLLAGHYALAEAQSSPSTPEQVVRDFFKAEQEGRWIEAAQLLDLRRFEPIRRSAIQSVRSLASRPNATAQQLMESDPTMPLAVAEYRLLKMRESLRSFDFLPLEFARVPSADSLAALPIDEAAARWLEAKGWKWQNELALREAMRRPETRCPEVPDSIVHAMRAQFVPPLSTILGATEASDSVRYVVVGFPRADSFGGKPAGELDYQPMSPRALTLRRLDGNWKIAPTPDMPHSDAFAGFTFAVGCAMEKPSKPGVPRK